MRPRDGVDSAGLLVLAVELFEGDEFFGREEVGELMDGDDLLRLVLDISFVFWSSLLELYEEGGQ